MKIVLSSHIGGMEKVNGERVPSIISEWNGLLEYIESIWIKGANVLFIAGSADDYNKNDDVHRCFKKAFKLSGLDVNRVDYCDNRNIDIIERLNEYQVIVLTGGHVPTENAFINKLKLRERLNGFDGIFLSWSAGSMNAADIVYAAPEIEGEALNPHYKRWIKGLGLTSINIFPHYESLLEEELDGLKVIEDITLPDSFVHELIALENGSFISIDDNGTIVHGNAYLIKDGIITKICNDGKTSTLFL